MSTTAEPSSAPMIDGVPHAAPPIAALQREAEVVAAFGGADEAEAAPPRGSLVRGSLVTIAGYGAGQVIRLAGNILVSRLVMPEAFGVMALVNILIQGLTMFSDVGIEQALVQHRRGDEAKFYNTAWTVQVLRGFVLLIAACGLAWPAAIAYDEPRLLTLLPAAALASLIAGFNSTALFAVRRHLLLGRLTVLELTSQIVGVSAMCLWAAGVSAGAWAMIVGALTTATVNLVGSHVLLGGHRNRFAWERDAASALFQFGRWVLVSTMVTFCALQVDRLLLGRMVTKEQLGVYSVALAVAMLPNMVLQTLAGAVLYPLLARYARRSKRELDEKLAAAREILTALGLFFVIGVVLEAETFFRLVYDSRYQAAGGIAVLLALSIWVQMLSTTLERVPQALGETRVLAAYNFIKLAACGCASYVGFRVAGLEGFILGYAVGVAAGHVALCLLLEQSEISVWRDDLRMSAAAILVAWIGLSLVAYAAACGSEPTSAFVLRETSAWLYLSLIGLWAGLKTRQLATLGG
ncbi:MAG: oligosaccharide flippase family protein [Planctomycetaceae bacterium]|nr:oligosaccharide flippase family protein [Planctomycetaceae bacterium]